MPAYMGSACECLHAWGVHVSASLRGELVHVSASLRGELVHVSASPRGECM